MEALFRKRLLRLSGRSDQAAFELAQAMGGGKTHLMTAFGLLAKYPHLRDELLSEDLAQQVDFGSARIAAFNARNDPDHYVWGELAEQLGQADLIRPYWADGPRGVPEEKWIQIIGDEPTLILLDELPPYLLTAALKLPRCCVGIANLSGSYEAQTKDLARILSDLQQEMMQRAYSAICARSWSCPRAPIWPVR